VELALRLYVGIKVGTQAFSSSLGGGQKLSIGANHTHARNIFDRFFVWNSSVITKMFLEK
jgi:hypothetical protein